MNNYPDNENDENPQEGQDIHLGPGEERHLPHEAWHEPQDRRRRQPRLEVSKDENENHDQDE